MLALATINLHSHLRKDCFTKKNFWTGKLMVSTVCCAANVSNSMSFMAANKTIKRDFGFVIWQHSEGRTRLFFAGETIHGRMLCFCWFVAVMKCASWHWQNAKKKRLYIFWSTLNHVCVCVWFVVCLFESSEDQFKSPTQAISQQQQKQWQNTPNTWLHFDCNNTKSSAINVEGQLYSLRIVDK